MVESINSLEMRVQRSEFKGKKEALFPAKDRGLVDRPTMHKELWLTAQKKAVAEEASVDQTVDRLRLSGVTGKNS